jgi:zinc protease
MKKFALIFLLAAAGFPLCAQKASVQPPRGESRPFKAPAIVQDSLPNGLRIVFMRVNELPLVELNLIIGAGLLRDPVPKQGLAQLAARLIVKRTATRTRNEIADGFSALGSTISTFAGYEYSQIYVRSLASTIPRTVDLLADICINSRPQESDLTTEIRALSAASAQVSMNPGEQTTVETLSLLFGEEHPLARSLFTQPRHLNSITPEDIASFMDSYYRPNNATLIVTGNMDYSAIRALFADRFGTWKRGVVPPLPLFATRNAPDSRAVVLEEPSLKIATIRMGYPAPVRASALFPACAVMDRIFGGGSESVLTNTFWREHKIHPGFFSTLGTFASRNYFIIGGYAPATKIDSVLMFLDQAIDRMCGGTLPKGSLDRVKRELTDGYEFEFATNKRAQKQLQEALLIGDLKGLDTYRQRIESLTAEDVAAAARAVFRSAPPVVAVAGSSELLVEKLRARLGRDVITKSLRAKNAEEDPR